MTDFIPSAFTTSITVITIGILCAALLAGIRFAKRKPKHEKHIKTACFVILGICLAGTACMAYLYDAGAKRGMTMDDWKSENVAEIIRINNETPVNQTLPEERNGALLNPLTAIVLNGAIVILYRYGCPDCEAIYDDLRKAIDELDLKDVYYVASSSEYGQELVEEGDIRYVPTGVYLRHEALANGASITHIQLASENGNETVLDQAALKRLALLQEKQR